MSDEQLDDELPELPEEKVESEIPPDSDQPHKDRLIAAIHKEKIVAALGNPKAKDDIDLLNEALTAYDTWIKKLTALKSTGETRVREMTALLNE